MLTFRGGRDVQAYPVSDDQAVSEINESLGLGIEQFMAGKKIAMLNAPAKYLQERNEKLAGLSADITKDYKAALAEVQTLTPGYENSLWVKQLAAEDALLRAKARRRQVNIEYPILGSAYKAQKSKNSRDLEGKKEFIKEASKG